MAVYFITGKLGAGKTLCAVGRIRDYLDQGRRVATNLDLNLTAMYGPQSRKHYIRLPDKPRLEDLQAIGKGCDEENEDRYGLIVLDELGTWFNSRTWQDKERLPVIDWFLHARKMHWDVYFLVQNISVVDPQLQNSLAEHLVVCRRTDRMTIPLLGTFLRAAGIEKVLPKIHIAKIWYGSETSGFAVGRWIYRGTDLYSCYDTSQKFRDEYHYEADGSRVDLRKTYTPLPPFHASRYSMVESLRKELAVIEDGMLTAGAQRPPSTWNPRTLALLAGVLLAVIYAGQSMMGSWNRLTRDRAAELAEKGTEQNIQVIPEAYVKPDPPKIKPEPDIESTESEGLAGIMAGSVLSLPVTIYRETGIDGIVWIEKSGTTYTVTLAEIRSEGWTVVEGENRVILIKQGQTIDIFKGANRKRDVLPIIEEKIVKTGL